MASSPQIISTRITPDQLERMRNNPALRDDLPQDAYEPQIDRRGPFPLNNHDTIGGEQGRALTESFLETMRRLVSTDPIAGIERLGARPGAAIQTKEAQNIDIATAGNLADPNNLEARVSHGRFCQQIADAAVTVEGANKALGDLLTRQGKLGQLAALEVMDKTLEERQKFYYNSLGQSYPDPDERARKAREFTLRDFTKLKEIVKGVCSNSSRDSEIHTKSEELLSKTEQSIKELERYLRDRRRPAAE